MRREREFTGDTRGKERAVRAGIMLTPSRLQSSPLGFQDSGQSSSQGLTALTQNVISEKAIHLIGARISPEDVKKFVVQKRVQLRSGVFLLAQLDADMGANAMAMIELKLENSKAFATRPGPWRSPRGDLRDRYRRQVRGRAGDMVNLGGQP